MAKDGTNRGGARIGSGQKKKALADKILDGNPGNRKLTIMDFTAVSYTHLDVYKRQPIYFQVTRLQAANKLQGGSCV